MVTCKGIQDVAVIGAGAAGLAAAKALREVGFNVAVYERLPAPGGVWLYRPNEGPMYDNLVTNIPKEVMQFTDVPFPSAWNSYCHHTQVLQYLQDYAERHGLSSVVRFGCTVLSVQLLPNDATPRWAVSYCAPDEKDPAVEYFDAVVVCNGHYNVPFEP
eukprot:EG_transcript_39280